MFIPEELTKDGNEKTIQVNHLGHFLLTKLLMPKLLEAKPARIINVSSLAHTWGKYLRGLITFYFGFYTSPLKVFLLRTDTLHSDHKSIFLLIQKI